MNWPSTALGSDESGARKQITAVFLDVVNFSSVASNADPEDLQDWLDAFYAHSRDIVEALGGQITEYLGDGVIALFGLLRADELAASKAVNAALSAIAEIDARGAGGISLKLRAGIATGEVVVRRQTADGLPRATGVVTTLAQRIQQKAPPGHVLMSDTTFALLRDTIAVEPVPDQLLKGFATPQILYRALRKQPLNRTMGQPIFFGRNQERRLIEQSDRPVLITGQAGIGKSALVRQMTQNAKGGTTIAGDGVNMRASYQPFARWITGETQQPMPTYHDLEVTFETLDRQAIDSLAMILTLPQGERLLAELSNVALKPMLEANIWAAICARNHAGFIVFEDLHWFDNASIDVVAHILRNRKATACKIIMTAREGTKINRYFDAVPLTEIALDPLDDDSAERMIAALSPADASPETQKMLVERAAGIPLYLEQLAKWQSADTKDDDVPSSLMDLLSEQIDATGPAKAVLQCGAVIGQKFDLSLLRAIAPEGASLEGMLRIAEAKGVVQHLDETQWSFRHALLQQVAYRGILRRQRVKIHAQIANYLQMHHPDLQRRAPAQLTNHLMLSEQYAPAIEKMKSICQWAFFHGALADADSHTLSAIALCRKVPAELDARALEISCQAIRGGIVMQTHGFSALPVRKVFERISKLAAEQNSFSADNGSAFYSSFMHALSMGDKARATWFADLLRDTAAHIDDPNEKHDLYQASLNLDVGLAFYSGAFEASSRSFARLRDTYDVDRRQNMITKYGMDSFASAQMFEAVTCAIRGDSHLVAGLSAETDAHQRLLNIPVMKPYALIWGGVALFFGGHERQALDRIGEGIALGETVGSAFWELTGAVWTFVFDPARSKNSEGLGAFEHTIQAHEMIGANLTLPFYKSHYALAVLGHGDADKAYQIATQARQEAESSGLHCWYAEILRINGRICSATGREDMARQMLEAAADIAMKQKANLWLLRARLDQMRLGLVDKNALAEVVATFAPSASLPDLEAAKKLIMKP